MDRGREEDYPNVGSQYILWPLAEWIWDSDFMNRGGMKSKDA